MRRVLCALAVLVGPSAPQLAGEREPVCCELGASTCGSTAIGMLLDAQKALFGDAVSIFELTREESLLRPRFDEAIHEAYEAGFLGRNACGSGYDFDVCVQVFVVVVVVFLFLF